MKTLLFIALAIISGATQEALPVLSMVLSMALGIWMIYLLVRVCLWFAKGSRGRRPPTDRQLDFIDALVEEREVDAWMLEEEPKNVKEASALITTLLKQPYRNEPLKITRRKLQTDDADFTI